MKRRIAVIVFMICIVAAGVLVLRTRITRAGFDTQSAEESSGIGIVYVFYANTYLSLDKNGIVCSNTSQKPGGIPEITGVEFSGLTYGKKAQPEMESALEYVIKVAVDLNKHEIRADRIAYQDRMVTVTIGNLDIKLGKNDKTDDKINDLSDFIDKIIGSSGTLYMQNGNANNYGYTFRANP